MGESLNAAGAPVTASTTARAVLANPAPAAGAKLFPEEPGACPRESADPSRPPERRRTAAAGHRRATGR